jgi:hypothetical protein
MNVAFFQFASSSIHFAASLEILKQEADAGSQNSYYLWGSCTSYPGRMSRGIESVRGVPPTWMRELIEVTSKGSYRPDRIEIGSDLVKENLELFVRQFMELGSINDLRKLEHSGIRPGPAIANEMTNITKNRDLNLKTNLKLFTVLIRSYLEVYFSTKRKLEDGNIGKVYLFNGRFLHERAVWDCAKNLGLEVLIFETTRNRYFIRKEGFHSRTNNQKVMIDHWNASSLSRDEKIRIGSKYFGELRSMGNPHRVEPEESFPFNQKYLVYFSSSDDEAVGFWEEWNEPLGNQLSVISQLQEIFDRQDEYVLVIRLHPNLANKGDEVNSNWSSIKSSRKTIVVGPNRKISSYELLDNSQAVVSYGSTIGLEAAFAKKPSIVLADCGYDEIGVVDKAENWETFLNWLASKEKFATDLLELRHNNSTIRGYFIATGGFNFSNSELVEIGWGSWKVVTFCGIRLPENIFRIKYQNIISKLKFLRIFRMVNRG